MSVITATARKSALVIAGLVVVLLAGLASVLTSETAANAAPAPSSATVLTVLTGESNTLLVGGGATASVGNVG